MAGTNDCAIYASAENYEALVEALKRRAGEIEISYSDLDAIAGLPAGFAGKVFGPSQTKKFGHLSLFNTLPALGLRLTLAVDPDALRQYALRRSRRRHGKQARPANFAARCGRRTVERVLRHLAAKLSWQEISALVGQARAILAAEQAAKAAMANSSQDRRRRSIIRPGFGHKNLGMASATLERPLARFAARRVLPYSPPPETNP